MGKSVEQSQQKKTEGTLQQMESATIYIHADKPCSFLSNFYFHPIKVKNRVYKSAEHFFQTTKCQTRADLQRIMDSETPKKAKIIGQYIRKHPEWEKNQTYLMELVLRCKFKKPSLKKKLKKTGNSKLVSLNYWHDTFWGHCVCSKHNKCGENKFGKLLMKIRSEL